MIEGNCGSDLDSGSGFEVRDLPDARICIYLPLRESLAASDLGKRRASTAKSASAQPEEFANCHLVPAFLS